MTGDGELSPETDIIIYEGTPFHEWRTEIMHFTIVPKDQVRVGIECRESFLPTKRLKKHLDDLSRFTHNVFLFAECCWSSRKSLSRKRREELMAMGFRDVFFLYRYYYGLNKEPNEEDWTRFLEMIRNL